MMPTWRVAYSGALAPTLELLHAPHLAHATRISFGNLDTLLGRPISLDPGDLQAKLVRVSVTVWEGTTFSARWVPDRNECVSAKWLSAGWLGIRTDRL
jgi:hypothetical protein